MYTIGQLNAAIHRNFLSILSSKLQEMNIKNGQYDFFYVISAKEGLSQKDLSEHLHIGKSTTAKAVKDLVGKGYVKKQRDKKDGRLDHLYLTEKGRQIAPTVSRIFEENLATAQKGMQPDEVEALMALMKKVLNNLVAENGRLVSFSPVSEVHENE